MRRGGGRKGEEEKVGQKLVRVREGAESVKGKRRGHAEDAWSRSRSLM